LIIKEVCYIYKDVSQVEQELLLKLEMLQKK